MKKLGIFSNNYINNHMFNIVGRRDEDGDVNFFLNLETDGIYLCGRTKEGNEFDVLKINNDGITLLGSPESMEDESGIRDTLNPSSGLYYNPVKYAFNEE